VRIAIESDGTAGPYHHYAEIGRFGEAAAAILPGILGRSPGLLPRGRIVGTGGRCAGVCRVVAGHAFAANPMREPG
jgi:hypothetical protein